MKLSLLNHTLAGETLALPIYNSMGICFIKEGSSLSSFIIDKLINMGCASVYLESPTQIVLEETLPATVHFDLVKKLKDLLVESSKSRYVATDAIEQLTQLFLNHVNLSENSIFVPNPCGDDLVSQIAEHSLEVAINAARIATARQFTRDRLATLISSALLHDMGKIISDAPDHMQLTCDILKSNPSFGATLYISILHMYETADGNGPFGLKLENIYENAQILHFANRYTKLLRQSNHPNETIEKLIAEATSKFDLGLVKIALCNLYSYPNGLVVELSSGQTGTITSQNTGLPLRPVVTLDSTQEPKDLSAELTLFIKKVLL
ncbi:MAG: HD-GYP domain-containing protein [Cellulosilyticaceae bacterium]